MPPDASQTASPRLTVLHLCSITSRGGTGYMASHICRLLHRAGHRVLVGTRTGGKVEERAREDGIALVDGLRLVSGFHPRCLAGDVLRLRRCFREAGVQIVNTWHSIEYWTAALAVLGTPVRLVRTRGLVTPMRGHVFNRLLHNRTAAVFATCRKIEENYRLAGLREENVFRLADGVDTERFRPGRDRMRVRQELGLAPETPLVANVGRMQGVKAQDAFLTAMANLPADVHAAVAGDGPLRETLHEQARALGLAERVHFLGMRSDIPDVLAAADLFALCSRGSEGSSRATLEAMATGLPCVTTTVGSLPDLIKPGRTGLLFPPNGVAELTECMEHLVNDAGLRRRLGEAACAYVRERHSEAAMLRSVEEVYQRILPPMADRPETSAGSQPA